MCRTHQHAFSLLLLLPVAVWASAENWPPNAAQSAPSARGGTPVLTVGNDAACNYLATVGSNGLQQAIDAAAGDANGAGATLIRLANTGTYVNRRFFINDLADQSIEIVGGYSSCSATSPTGTTFFDRGTATPGPVFLIDAVAAGQVVTLQNLRVTGGDNGSGGGLELRNNNFLLLDDVRVESNTATDGGGLSVADTDDGVSTTVWMLGATRLVSNQATNGGGLRCSGAGASVVLDTDVTINANSAVRGGGIRALSGCQVGSFASFPSGIFSNVATEDGGGAHLTGGARLTLIGGAGSFGFGDASRRTTLDGNTAERSGGGIYASDAGTRVSALDSWIVANSADADDDGIGEGGAVRLWSGARLAMDRTLAGAACHDPLRCSRLGGNSAASGGAVYATGNDVEIDLRQTWIESNSASNLATAMLISNGGGDLGRPGRLLMEGNMIVGHDTSTTSSGGLQGVVDLQSNTRATIAFTTFASNLTSSNGRNIIMFNDVDLDLYTSILWETSGQALRAIWDADTRGSVDCLLTFDDANLPPGAFGILGDNPQLDLNYLLTGASPAIDYCDSAVYSPSETDILGTARGNDTVGAPNILGPFDLGAHEFTGTLDGGAVRFTTPIVQVTEDHGTLTIPVERVGASEGVLEVLVFTLDGTALQGPDYLEFDETVTWLSGDSANRLVSVPIVDDALAEGPEHFTVNLLLIDGAGTIGTPATLSVTIFDNEQGIFADGFEARLP